MSLPVTGRAAALGALELSAAKWVDLLRAAKDPNRNAIGHWSVGDVAAHTSHLGRLFVDMAHEKGSPVSDHLRMSDDWEKELQKDKERNLSKLADRIEQSASDLRDIASDAEWTKPVSWHAGIQIPFYTLISLFVNESELHGLDVARAESRPWTIDDATAALVIQGLFPILPHFVKAEVAGDKNITWQLRVRGSKPVYLLLRSGELTVSVESPGEIDCRVTVSPTEYLLVGYGRKSQWGPVFTGKIVAWGRKPWLSLTLAKLFHTP